MGYFQEPVKIFDAKAATGIGTPLNVADYDHIILALDTASSANGTIKFQGSIQKARPTFSSAQAFNNIWDYIEVKDLEDGSAIDGDTGVALAGTDDHRLFEMNVSGLTWICAEMTAYAAGTWYLVAFARSIDS